MNSRWTLASVTPDLIGRVVLYELDPGGVTRQGTVVSVKDHTLTIKNLFGEEFEVDLSGSRKCWVAS